MNASTEVTIQKSALPSMAMSETDLIGVLSSSLYLGAAKNSILMVLSYCKATGLDPMQKPVHIVPMWDKNSKAMRDVVMPDGVAGDCDGCGEYFARLVGGKCGFCRDGRRRVVGVEGLVV